jgi:hypothetical protein
MLIQSASRCFAYWCIQPQVHLGDKLDNYRYPNISPIDLRKFYLKHPVQEIHRADEKLGYQI